MSDAGDKQIAEAIRSAASLLGTSDAATPMGAIEMLAMEIKEGATRIADALALIAEAIENDRLG